MFLAGARKSICTAPFMNALVLPSRNTWKANVCIFLQISVRKFLFQRRRTLLFGRRLNKFLQATRYLGPAIALKHWNFPDNLDFKGEVVEKFLLRSHFVSIYDNMTTKQQINHGVIQKVGTCIMPFFIPLTCIRLCQFYSITSLVLFIKNYKLWNERKDVFWTSGCFSLSRYIKGSRKWYL